MRALLLLLVALSANGGKLEQIRARGKLIVSVKNDAARPHKDPAHAQKRGFELELVRAFAKRILGDENQLELRLLARPVRLAMLDTGSVDLVVSMIPLDGSAAMSHPYFASALALMVRSDSKVRGLGDVTTVAVLKQGFNDYGREISRLKKLTVRYYPTFEDAANAVQNGEASAMAGNLVDMQLYLKSRSGFRVEMLQKRLHGVAVKKGDDDLLQLVNDSIDELKGSGELRKMAERWQLPYLL